MCWEVREIPIKILLDLRTETDSIFIFYITCISMIEIKIVLFVTELLKEKHQGFNSCKNTIWCVSTTHNLIRV